MNGCQWCTSWERACPPCELRGSLAHLHVTLLSIVYVARQGRTASARHMLMEAEAEEVRKPV